MRTGIVSVADETCAILAFGGALAALTYARATGIGQKVECSLLGGQMSRDVPGWDAFVGFAGPIFGFANTDYLPWDSATGTYTNPLWQHYVRLNRADSGLAKNALEDKRKQRSCPSCGRISCKCV